MPIQFTTYRYADVSTQHIRPEDGDLIRDVDAPNSLAVGQKGDSFFYVSSDKNSRQEFENFGFSPEFCAIFAELHRQGIPYVRFDPLGHSVEGLPTFEW